MKIVEKDLFVFPETMTSAFATGGIARGGIARGGGCYHRLWWRLLPNGGEKQCRSHPLGEALFVSRTTQWC